VELHLDAFEVATAQGRRYLNTSPEYHMKRLLAAGSGPIWQACKVFRAGELGPRHNPEFTMLEWYLPGYDRDRLIDEVCALIAACGVVEDPGAVKRLSVDDALRTYAGRSLSDLPPVGAPERIDRWSWWMSTEVEPALASQGLVALVDYPADMASLARVDPDDPALARRFEIYVDGVELANGFEELTDPVEQRRRMEAERTQRRAAGKPELPFDDRFLDALEDLPACTGVAVGVDRLVMLATGADDVRRTLAFPWSEA
jgi:lysyl-tRNA synthetase class 2